MSKIKQSTDGFFFNIISWSTGKCVLGATIPGNVQTEIITRAHGITLISAWMNTLKWRHKGCDDVSNHQPYDCLLNCLIRRRSKKTSKFHVTGLCARNSPLTGEFPHKGPVTRKMFPFDDVIMSHNHYEVGNEMNCFSQPLKFGNGWVINNS